MNATYGSTPEPTTGSNRLKDQPIGERPRERLIERGPVALSPAELIAILVRTGLRGVNAVYSRFPNFASNADEQRQLKAEIYKSLLRVVSGKRMVNLPKKFCASNSNEIPTQTYQDNGAPVQDEGAFMGVQSPGAAKTNSRSKNDAKMGIMLDAGLGDVFRRPFAQTRKVSGLCNRP